MKTSAIRRLSTLFGPLLFLTASALVAWKARGFPEAPAGVPGPAVAPLILAVLLGAAGLVLLVQAWRETLPQDENAPSILKPLLVLIAAMAGYALLMPRMGFISTSALFVFICLRVFGYHNTLRGAAIALALAFVLYGIFAQLMRVPLPEGWIG